MMCTGGYVVLFVLSLWILISNRRAWYFIVTTVVMFSLATTTISALLRLNMHNFSQPDETPALTKTVFTLRVCVPLS
jgi:heme/copper-type cytochrome/quinol oxidase subunit 4